MKKTKWDESPKDYRFKHRVDGHPKVKKELICDKFYKPQKGGETIVRESNKT